MNATQEPMYLTRAQAELYVATLPLRELVQIVLDTKLENVRSYELAAARRVAMIVCNVEKALGGLEPS